MRKHLAKPVIMIGLPLLLGGCGLPPALSAASWALDGISYLASGKSVTDHAISEVAQQDCALFRVVQGREFCEADTDDIQTAEGPQIIGPVTPYGDNWQASDDAPPLEDPFVVPAEMAEFVDGFGPGIVVVNDRQTAAAFAPVAANWRETRGSPGRFADAAPKPRPAYLNTPVYDIARSRPQAPTGQPERPSSVRSHGQAHVMSVVGSFKSIDNAWKQAHRYASLDAQVRSMRVDGRTWHRVVVDAPLSRVRQMGAVDAWALRLCNTDGTLPPCGPATISSAGVVTPHDAVRDVRVN
ncbi:MAG: hypothetical protein O3B37_07940 [Proteobacteria bacterium]|nr:hypothetical protein [Pseudomonadota bacterium]